MIETTEVVQWAQELLDHIITQRKGSPYTFGYDDGYDDGYLACLSSLLTKIEGGEK